MRSAGADSTDEDEDDRKSEITFEDEKGEKKRHRFKLPSGVTAAIKSIKGRDTAADDGTTSVPVVPSNGPTEAQKIKAAATADGGAVHPPTQYNGPEYKNEALDTSLPTSPLKAYKLFFKEEAFLRKFLEEKEKLLGAFSSFSLRSFELLLILTFRFFPQRSTSELGLLLLVLPLLLTTNTL
jgi:hypothetical protein